MAGEQGAFLRHGGVLAGIAVEIDAGFHRFVRNMPGIGTLDFAVPRDRHQARDHLGAGRSASPPSEFVADQFDGFAGPLGGGEVPGFERGRDRRWKPASAGSASFSRRV